jgi:hypothetical protein
VSVATSSARKARRPSIRARTPKQSKEQIEKENKKGTSLGQWGPPRGISVLTIEMPEQYDTSSPVTDAGRKQEIDSRAEALEEIFLGPTPEAMSEALVEDIKGAAQAVADFFTGGGSSPP